MNLLSSSDINKIIASLDRTTSLFKECKLFDDSVSEAHLLNETSYGFKDASKSLTEIVDSKMAVPGVGTPRVFFKIWFRWDQIEIRRRKEIIDANPTQIEELGLGNISRNNSDVVSSLAYEAKIYKYITDNIILKNKSPNFIAMLMNQTCNMDTILKSLAETGHVISGQKELLSKINRIKSLFGPIDMQFIMTGSGYNVITMHDFIKFLNNPRDFPSILGTTRLDSAGKVGFHEYHAIFVQFLYTFYLLHAHKIMHNDNHFSNVLIQILDEPVTISIYVNLREIKFTTKYIVKFFDWDRAYCEFIGQNDMLINFQHSRTNNVFVPNRDFSMFLCTLLSGTNERFKHIVNNLIPENDSIQREIKTGDEAIMIPMSIPPKLTKWINDNRLNPNKVHPNGYITISREELDSVIPDGTNGKGDIKRAIYEKIVDEDLVNRMDYSDLYNSLSNIYLQIYDDGDEEVEEGIVIPRGWKCNPLTDNRHVNIEQYFTNDAKFEQLTQHLVVDNRFKHLKYTFDEKSKKQGKISKFFKSFF